MPAAATTGLAGARSDLAAGRLWKARDRLHGVRHHRPADQEVLDLLGEVCFRMGDLPAAGRAWFLTDRDDEDARAARAAFHERYGRDPAQVIGQLALRAPIEDFPAAVQDRLRSLRSQAGEAGSGWEPGRGPSRKETGAVKTRLSNALSGTLVFAAGLVFLLGVFAVAELVIGFF